MSVKMIVDDAKVRAKIPMGGSIGARIRSARMKAGLAQRALAQKLDVSPSAVAKWELGGTPATDRLPILANVLNVSLDWLLGQKARDIAPSELSKSTSADLQIIEEARRLGLDLDAIVREARQKRWVEENREALSDANSFFDRYGLWSDGKRQF